MTPSSSVQCWHSLQGLQARATVATAMRQKTRNMSGGVRAESGVRGRRRPSYYRPRAAPPITLRGQGDGRSGQVHGNATTATGSVTVVGAAARHPTARAQRIGERCRALAAMRRPRSSPSQGCWVSVQLFCFLLFYLCVFFISFTKDK